MTKSTENLASISDRIRTDLAAKDGAREKALPACREAIRHCSESIRSIHRQEFDKAIGSLAEARKLLDDVEQSLSGDIDLANTNFLRDAQKEYAEGRTFLAVVRSEPLPDPKELRVDPAAFLNGVGEAVGEMRRYVLDGMRHGDLSRGEELLGAMDDIYSVLVTIDFPDAITGGLRRTTDMVRGVLEKTRSDLTLAIGQKSLENRLTQVEKNLK